MRCGTQHSLPSHDHRPEYDPGVLFCFRPMRSIKNGSASHSDCFVGALSSGERVWDTHSLTTFLCTQTRVMRLCVCVRERECVCV